MYLRIKEDLRPRPSKAHYTFNLRDLSKVFQGVCPRRRRSLRQWSQMCGHVIGCISVSFCTLLQKSLGSPQKSTGWCVAATVIVANDCLFG